jgi:phospholipid/cholesterol/gamma-HCH transport system ATP-binding protein
MTIENRRTGTALEVREIKKSFGNKVVHRGVSFELRWGEILGLLGGSGTGKSVILRSIIGLEKPDAGQILFDQHDLVRLSERELFPIRTRIAYVFQNGALFDSLSVEDNLAYPLREHTKLKETEILQKVNEMLAAVDMTGSNNLFPAELSGGMQKRAGLARATILNPEIILFDEPTAGLDPVNTHRLVRNLQAVKNRGITGIFVTHDLPAAFELCHRIAILKDGRIHVVDTVDNIRKSEDPFVYSFIRGEEDDGPPSPSPNSGLKEFSS